jgi:hypothetical protein
MWHAVPSMKSRLNKSGEACTVMDFAMGLDGFWAGFVYRDTLYFS